ncbi:MAG: helix-turn-helix transcriptional regulator [Clostridiales bacterium]|jgi:transcriptional regulator with XRE-family HTH domain|nr:helix-turn-helix transcriptional regulator [Clostridiales bacterium]MDR2750574.1 helix-turn-helix transcriptional regulator [Clostridiales bacterium]
MIYDVEMAQKLKHPELVEDKMSLEPELTIVQAIQEFRMDSGITQIELSEVSGVSQGDISKIERGLLSPTIKTLKKLAKAFNKRIILEFVPASQPSKISYKANKEFEASSADDEPLYTKDPSQDDE